MNSAQAHLPEVSKHAAILIMLTDGEPTEGKQRAVLEGSELLALRGIQVNASNPRVGDAVGGVVGAGQVEKKVQGKTKHGPGTTVQTTDPGRVKAASVCWATEDISGRHRIVQHPGK